jgi:hypothetical protein
MLHLGHNLSPSHEGGLILITLDGESALSILATVTGTVWQQTYGLHASERQAPCIVVNEYGALVAWADSAWRQPAYTDQHCDRNAQTNEPIPAAAVYGVQRYSPPVARGPLRPLLQGGKSLLDDHIGSGAQPARAALVTASYHSVRVWVLRRVQLPGRGCRLVQLRPLFAY